MGKHTFYIWTICGIFQIFHVKYVITNASLSITLLPYPGLEIRIFGNPPFFCKTPNCNQYSRRKREYKTRTENRESNHVFIILLRSLQSI